MIGVYQHTGHWASCCQWMLCINTHFLLSSNFSIDAHWSSRKLLALNDWCIDRRDIPVIERESETLLMIGVYWNVSHWDWASCCHWTMCINTNFLLSRESLNDQSSTESLLMTGRQEYCWSMENGGLECYGVCRYSALPNVYGPLHMILKAQRNGQIHNF
jgi:hypothetical protein